MCQQSSVWYIHNLSILNHNLMESFSTWLFHFLLDCNPPSKNSPMELLLFHLSSPFFTCLFSPLFSASNDSDGKTCLLSHSSFLPRNTIEIYCLTFYVVSLCSSLQRHPTGVFWDNLTPFTDGHSVAHIIILLLSTSLFYQRVFSLL